MRRLRSLSEAECYARCYGASDDAVRVLWAEERDPVVSERPPLTGEDVRRLFEPRLVPVVPEAA